MVKPGAAIIPRNTYESVLGRGEIYDWPWCLGDLHASWFLSALTSPSGSFIGSELGKVKESCKQPRVARITIEM